jgi:hypothetical protein
MLFSSDHQVAGDSLRCTFIRLERTSQQAHRHWCLYILLPRTFSFEHLQEVSLFSVCQTSTSRWTLAGVFVSASIPAHSCYLKPSRNTHDMTDSSLTTPLPHLKFLYYTHMGGLAVSGSHGLIEFSEKCGQRNTHSGPYASTRLWSNTDTCYSWSR